MSNFSERLKSFEFVYVLKVEIGGKFEFRYFLKKFLRFPLLYVYPGEANVILYQFSVVLEKLGGVFFGVGKFLAVHLVCLTLCFGLLSILPVSL